MTVASRTAAATGHCPPAPRPSRSASRASQGPTSEQVSAHVTLFGYSRCRDGADVEYYRVTGGGHTWPGTAVDLSPLGVTTQEISATQLMWQFFEDHPKR